MNLRTKIGLRLLEILEAERRASRTDRASLDTGLQRYIVGRPSAVLFLSQVEAVAERLRRRVPRRVEPPPDERGEAVGPVACVQETPSTSLQHDFVRVDASDVCVSISRTRAEMIHWSQGRSQNQAGIGPR